MPQWYRVLCEGAGVESRERRLFHGKVWKRGNEGIGRLGSYWCKGWCFRDKTHVLLAWPWGTLGNYSLLSVIALFLWYMHIYVSWPFPMVHWHHLPYLQPNVQSSFHFQIPPNPLNHNYLALEIPWIEEPGRTIVHGLAKSWTRLSHWAHKYSEMNEGYQLFIKAKIGAC